MGNLGVIQWGDNFILAAMQEIGALREEVKFLLEVVESNQ